MPPHPNTTVENSRPTQGAVRDPKTNMNIARASPRPDMVRQAEPSVPPRIAQQQASSSAMAMYRESERIKTFDTWPIIFISPAQMAAAGFYFTQNADIVKCAFCNIEVGHWVHGDDPMVDHKKWSPSCRFVRNAPNENIPLSGVDRESEEIGYDTCGAYGINIPPEKSGQSLESLKVQKARPPSFPKYVTHEERLRSFRSWPVSLKIKPQTLSEAGFFYAGEGDQTLCFHCGGGLKDWEETDEPWVEHARWFSKCNYVLLIKGQTFIDEVSGQKNKEKSEQNPTGPGSGLSSSMGALDQLVEVKKEEDKEKNLPSTSGSTPNSEGKSTDENDVRICKICYGAEMGIAFLPCGHIVACPHCAASMSKCASCRQPIEATVRVFIS